MQLCKSPKLSNILNVHDQFHNKVIWKEVKYTDSMLCVLFVQLNKIKYYMYVTVTCEKPIVDKKLGERNNATVLL